MGQTEIILASGSPRRRELLGQLGLTFSVEVPRVEERMDPEIGLDEAIAQLARRKARAVAARRPRALVIGADTLVVLDGRPLGKPASPEQAARMLRALSGRRHEVWTAMTLCRGRREQTVVEKTAVFVRPLSSGEIARYVATGESMDKAGAYGIQGRGAAFISRIEGDYYTVVGLPLCRLARLLPRWLPEIDRKDEPDQCEISSVPNG